MSQSRAEISETIADLEHKLEDLLATIEIARPAYDYLVIREQNLKAEMQAVREAKADKEQYLNVWESQATDLKEQLEAWKRALARLVAEQDAHQRLMEMEEEFNRLTADAPWREKIRDYQLQAAYQMAAMKRGIVADKRGLGKSLTGLAWADMLKSKRLLILAPRKSAINLRREMARWAPHRQLFYLVGSTKKQRDIVLTQVAQIGDLIPNFTVIVNLEAWRKDKDLVDHLRSMMFDSVIIDEAHKVKEQSSLMWKGVNDILYWRSLCPSCGKKTVPVRGEDNAHVKCKHCTFTVPVKDSWDAFCPIKNVLLTTGSPWKNRPDELWAELFLLDRIGFPRILDFRNDFLEWDWTRSEYIWADGGKEALIEKLGMRYIARTKKDVGLDVLPVTEETIEVVFNKNKYPEQWKEYWRLQDELEVMLESGETLEMTAVIAQLTRLQQMAIWPPSIKIFEQSWDNDKQKWVKGNRIIDRVNVRESAILDAAEELIRDAVDEGERVIVFSKFTDHNDELASRLNDRHWTNESGLSEHIPSVVLSQRTTPQQMDEIMTDFDQRTYDENVLYQKQWDVLLTTYQSGGESLNFTAASRVILIEPAWGPEDESQAIGRVDRFGQKQPVTVSKLSLTTGEGGRVTCYQWLEGINEHKRNQLEGFEQVVSIAELVRAEARRGRRNDQ